MIIVKVINQRVAQIAFATQPNSVVCSVLATRNQKHIINFARHLVQSTSHNQKVTNANNQQLIPIARNISFRQCMNNEIRSADSNSKVLFSLSASSPSPLISTEYDPAITLDHQTDDRLESPLETLKRRAKDVVEKRESAARSRYYGQSFNETLATPSERRLVVLLSWLEAKEKHIEKYRQFYLERGFDVLNVKTSPLDLLLPNNGARKISEDFVRFMIDKQYSNVLLHGFSVGGYMFGRLMLEIERLDAKLRERLMDSVQGVVFDSVVPFEGICVGVANSITGNKLAAKVLEGILRVYLVLGRNIATKHYSEASAKVWSGPLRCPALFLQSKDDIISDSRIVDRLANGWEKSGIDVRRMVVESSPHVQLFSKHHEMYKTTVEDFLKHIKLL